VQAAAPESAQSAPAATGSPDASEPRSHRRLRISILAAALALAVLASAAHRILASDYLWHNPIANARLATVTEFDGIEQSATISRDGKFIAFLSDRDGHTDIWLTQTS
jgi:hypothetical protein